MDLEVQQEKPKGSYMKASLLVLVNILFPLI